MSKKRSARKSKRKSKRGCKVVTFKRLGGKPLPRKKWRRVKFCK